VTPFTGAYFPDTLQEFVEVVLAEAFGALFKPLIIKGEALGDELFQGPGCPDAELGGLEAVHPVADGDDGGHPHAKQLSQGLLGQPDGLPLK
jgi:hypothetical protein